MNLSQIIKSIESDNPKDEFWNEILNNSFIGVALQYRCPPVMLYNTDVCFNLIKKEIKKYINEINDKFDEEDIHNSAIDILATKIRPKESTPNAPLFLSNKKSYDINQLLQEWEGDHGSYPSELIPFADALLGYIEGPNEGGGFCYDKTKCISIMVSTGISKKSAQQKFDNEIFLCATIENDLYFAELYKTYTLN
jgi:hypothetical protein